MLKPKARLPVQRGLAASVWLLDGKTSDLPLEERLALLAGTCQTTEPQGEFHALMRQALETQTQNASDVVIDRSINVTRHPEAKELLRRVAEGASERVDIYTDSSFSIRSEMFAIPLDLLFSTTVSDLDLDWLVDDPTARAALTSAIQSCDWVSPSETIAVFPGVFGCRNLPPYRIKSYARIYAAFM